MGTIDIRGLDKAEVLAALYNSSRPPQGMGTLQAREGVLSVEDARNILTTGFGDDLHRMVKGAPSQRGAIYFDYLFGKVLKIDLAQDDMRIDLYDRDNGVGAAERALAPLRRA